jgi:hypothetical protein
MRCTHIKCVHISWGNACKSHEAMCAHLIKTCAHLMTMYERKERKNLNDNQGKIAPCPARPRFAGLGHVTSSSTSPSKHVPSRSPAPPLAKGNLGGNPTPERHWRSA